MMRRGSRMWHRLVALFARPSDIQPWMDFVEVLDRYRNRGYLELASPGEAYVTMAAISTLAGIDPLQAAARTDYAYSASLWDKLKGVARYIMVYAAYSGCAGLPKSYAVNVVGDRMPHEPLFVILVCRRRSWRTAWRMKDCFKIVFYGQK